MSSSYWYGVAISYRNEKKEYEDFKTQIEAILPYFDQVSDNLKLSSNYLDEVIICGKPYDYNFVSGSRDLSNMVDIVKGVKKDCQSLCLECETKIAELASLEQDALDNYFGALESEKNSQEEFNSI